MAGFQVPVFCWSCGHDFEGVGRAECPRCKPPAKPSEPVPHVMYWMDRRVDELPHAELLQAFHQLADIHRQLMEENRQRIQFYADLFRRNS